MSNRYCKQHPECVIMNSPFRWKHSTSSLWTISSFLNKMYIITYDAFYNGFAVTISYIYFPCKPSRKPAQSRKQEGIMQYSFLWTQTMLAEGIVGIVGQARKRFTNEHSILTCLGQTPSEDPREGHTQGLAHRVQSSSALWCGPAAYWSSWKSLSLTTPTGREGLADHRYLGS